MGIHYGMTLATNNQFWSCAISFPTAFKLVAFKLLYSATYHLRKISINVAYIEAVSVKLTVKYTNYLQIECTSLFNLLVYKLAIFDFELCKLFANLELSNFQVIYRCRQCIVLKSATTQIYITYLKFKPVY